MRNPRSPNLPNPKSLRPIEKAAWPFAGPAALAVSVSGQPCAPARASLNVALGRITAPVFSASSM